MVDLNVILFFTLPDELLILVGALELTRYGLEKLAHRRLYCNRS